MRGADDYEKEWNVGLYGEVRQAGLPIHDGSCMGAGVVPIWGEPPARVKQVDARSEVAIAWVCCHDAKLFPEDVGDGHVCMHTNAKLVTQGQPMDCLVL